MPHGPLEEAALMVLADVPLALSPPRRRRRRRDRVRARGGGGICPAVLLWLPRLSAPSVVAVDTAATGALPSRCRRGCFSALAGVRKRLRVAARRPHPQLLPPSLLDVGGGARRGGGGFDNARRDARAEACCEAGFGNDGGRGTTLLPVQLLRRLLAAPSRALSDGGRGGKGCRKG